MHTPHDDHPTGPMTWGELARTVRAAHDAVRTLFNDVDAAMHGAGFPDAAARCVAAVYGHMAMAIDAVATGPSAIDRIHTAVSVAHDEIDIAIRSAGYPAGFTIPASMRDAADRVFDAVEHTIGWLDGNDDDDNAPTADGPDTWAPFDTVLDDMFDAIAAIETAASTVRGRVDVPADVRAAFAVMHRMAADAADRVYDVTGREPDPADTGRGAVCDPCAAPDEWDPNGTAPVRIGGYAFHPAIARVGRDPHATIDGADASTLAAHVHTAVCDVAAAIARCNVDPAIVVLANRAAEWAEFAAHAIDDMASNAHVADTARENTGGPR